MSKWGGGPAVVMLWMDVEKKLVKGAGNLVEKILQQSLAKVPGKELKNTKPKKPVVKRGSKAETKN